MFGADGFDIQARRAPQLTFGHDYGLGSALARTELAEALPILAKLCPGLALADEPKICGDLSGMVGPEVLPISFAAPRSVRESAASVD